MTEKTSEAAPLAAEGPYEVSPGLYMRLTGGLGGYVLALAACFLLVGAIVLITPRSDKEVLPTVDYSADLWALRGEAPYTAYAPQGPPAGWRPTSSRLTRQPVAWHLGFVTPGDEYAALEQSDERATPFIKRMTNAKTVSGTQQVAGATWQRYFRKDKDQRSLVRGFPGVTVVVTGTASYEELAVLAAALRPQPRTRNAPVPGRS